MKTRLVDSLFSRLEARGFSGAGASPHGTMALDRAFVANQSLAELFERMVARREKIAALFATDQSPEIRQSYDDVCKVVEVVKGLVDELAG